MTVKGLDTIKSALVARLDTARSRLVASLSTLSTDQAFQGTQWSAADCLNHLAPKEGGYGSYVQTLLAQEHPTARAYSRERRWSAIRENLAAEHKLCQAALAQVTAERWDAPVALPDGGTRPLSFYVETMVKHFEEHANQIIEEIVPRLRATA